MIKVRRRKRMENEENNGGMRVKGMMRMKNEKAI